MNVKRGDGGKLVLITTNFQGQVVYIPMQVIIDGVGYNPEGSNAIRFFGMPADRIKSMAIAGTSIIVRTRSIPRSTEKYLNSGILTINHPGYTKAREFSLTNKTDYPLLSTKYWIPTLKISDSTIIIPFNVSKQLRDYLLTIEGVSSTGKIISYSQLIKQNQIDP